MAKRAFVRRDGLLFDTYLLPNGKECTAQIPGHMLGEPLASQHREKAIASLKSDQFADTNAVSDEDSPQHLEALLDALRKGNIAAPMHLLRYLSDPRVRPALVAAASAAPNGNAANFLQVIGIAGGRGAKELLRERIEWLAAASGTWKDDSFFNRLAGDLSTASRALLNLDAEAEDAGEALERLCRHVCAFNRHSAIGNAAFACRRGVATAAMEIVRRALQDQLRSDDGNFVAALGALLELDPKVALARCETLLHSADSDTTVGVVNRLTENVDVPGVTPLLVRWIESAPHDSNALGAACSVRASLRDGVLETLIARALASESPATRWRAVDALSSVEKARRSALVTTALVDEPDPALRQLLGESIGGP